MSHTPGPWHVVDTNFGAEVISASEDWIGDINTLDSARLISAAPDLLEACRIVREFCALGQYDGMVRILDSAIRKATGE